MRLKLTTVTLVLLLASSSVWSAVTGTITGIITDSQSKELLVGVSVSVVGTNLGDITDVDGRFSILNVPQGTYTLKISSVGYGTLEVDNVAVSADLTSYQNHEISSQAADIGKTIRVTAERPLIIRDKVASVQIITKEELLALPIRGFADVVGIQNGVVANRTNNTFGGVRGNRGQREASNGPELTVRGGRPSEVAYYVDGFSQQDPLTGLSTANISNNAIEEIIVISGGFPVEYGHVASGVVNVITRSGADRYSGTVEAITDNVTSQNFDQNWYTADLRGPIPGLPKASFFGSIERRWQGDRNPSSVTDDFLGGDRLPSNNLSGWSYQGKIDYEFTKNVKLSLSGTGSRDEWREYFHQYFFNQAHMPYYDDKNIGLNAKFTHTLNSKTFYNLSGTFFQTERFRGDGVFRKDIFAYGRPNGNPRNEVTGLFRSFDDPSTPITTSQLWFITDTNAAGMATDSSLKTFVTGGDEAHVWDDYLKRKSSYVGFKGQITSEVTSEHTVKAGFEFNRHTLRFYQHLTPVAMFDGVNQQARNALNRYGYDGLGNESDDQGVFNDTKHPIDVAGYLQDRFEYRGLIITAGVRLDVFDYKALRLKNPALPLDPDSNQFDGVILPNDLFNTSLDLDDLEESKTFTRLSPRLGMAFPLTENTQMRVSYGKFFQRPDLQNLYVGYDFLQFMVTQGGFFTTFGNPNLEPPKTTAYEVGITHKLGDNSSVDVNVYYRDVSDLIQSFTQPSQPASFTTFKNDDFGTIKGLEFAFKMRRTQNIALDIKYTLQSATGTGSFNTTNGNVAWVGAFPPKQTAPLDFDQRHSINANFDLRFGSKQGPRIGDSYPLEKFGLNVLFRAGSGLPYTPIKIVNEVTQTAFAPVPLDTRNSEYGDWTLFVDLKAEREFNFGGNKVTPYVWVKNLLDRDNVITVYEGTGSATSTGWLATPEGQAFVQSFSTPDRTDFTGEQKLRLAENNPTNFANPRQILFGLRVSF